MDIVLKCGIISIVLFFSVHLEANECQVAPTARIDCYPDSSSLSEDGCIKRGCCFNAYAAETDNVPWCYFPIDYSYSYILTQLKQVSYGYEGELKIANFPSPYPSKPLSLLKLFIFFETPECIHFKITDSNSTRYEVPIGVPKIDKRTALATKYEVETSALYQTFTLRVTRKDTKIAVFDTKVGPLLYGDQYLQISTGLSSPNIYGLGERHASLRPDILWNRISFWAADRPPGFPKGGNLYGDHPFYLSVEPDGLSHGVFFLNSNAKEAELTPKPALTWRTIGGILDFYVFLGPSPDEVIRQYTAVVGRPFMPPMWGLGYHLCRWGYKTANNTLGYVEKMREAKIPQDVQWNDIDYMRDKLDFTYDGHNFSQLPDLVNNLHNHGQHYVMILDPGISDHQPKNTYPPYDDAIEMSILVSDANTKQPVRGKVWPGGVVFPDFTHPKTKDYWEKQLSTFHSLVPFDGVWIDMNEYSNFMDGSPEMCYRNSSYDYPPYVPKVTGGALFSKTVCPSSLQYLSNNYNVHSITGLMEMKITSEAIVKIRKKRPFVISRSTFPSSGKYGGHWTGDIKSSWEHLRLSVPGILSFNLFGIPLVGADICGFGGSTTEELCIRWSQLGAFYPFSRNHNDIAGSPQAPVDFSEKTRTIIRNALDLRYTLLPYLYTLFHHAHSAGTTVARPLLFEFPLDENTYSIDEQFLWGPGLMISPVLEPGATTVRAYFPSGVWYDMSVEFGNPFASAGETLEVSAPLENIPVHIRGGHIIPGCMAGTVTNMTNKFVLFVAADEQMNAKGSLFWDDGDSLDTFENEQYAFIQFTLQGNKLLSKLLSGSHNVSSSMFLSTVFVLGAKCNPTEVRVNGNAVPYHVDIFGNFYFETKSLCLNNLLATWICK